MAVAATDLVGAFVRFLEDQQDPEQILAPDVFADFNIPHWRFQMQGADVLARQLREDAPNGAAVTLERHLPTPGGFVAECSYVADDHIGPGTVYRTVWLCDVVDERITEVVLYCTGEWDQVTQAHHAEHAPMLRGAR